MNGKYYESEYEEAFVGLLHEQGWNVCHGEDLHRQFTDVIIEDDLMAFLHSKYNGMSLGETDFETIAAKIRNVGGPTDYLAHCAAYKLYHDGFNYTFADASKQAFHLDYIDYEHPGNNIFRAVNQFEIHQGNENRRPDIMLFINGIPVGIIELKNPTDSKATIRDAHTQITVRYRRDVFSLLQYCSVACISDGSNTRLGTVFTPYEYFYAWKKVSNTDKAGKGVDEMRSMIAGALSPSRIVMILRDYLFIPDVTDDEDDETEIICRYQQFFASEMLRDYIIKHLRSKGGDGKGGIYFGATGCGKTYTMLFLAKQLAMRCREQIGSPTILIIVDREDLESQSGKLFCRSTGYLYDDSVKVFETRKELGDEMRSRESGGLYITTIQKFTSETGLLSDRSNIICFSDEAHRTQNNIGSKLKITDKSDDPSKLGAYITYGFAKYLHDALPNATYAGFTGTPIDEMVHVFGGVVDSYTMRQAKDDDITVELKYLARLARVFSNSEQIKKIEEYYRLCDEEGADEEDIRRSKAAMSSMNVILGDPDRLQRLAVDMVAHYESMCYENPDLVQKAMVVCSDRKIAYNLYNIIKELRPDWTVPRKTKDESVLTQEQLDKLEPVPFVNIIATRDKDDPKAMYDLLGDKEYRKDLATKFKDDKSNFYIAIVVDMWITGFDVPCLSVLYNDKPLQKHSLIQTISRVNRKYKTKKYGLIVDYIGIRENMKKAMKKYGGGGEGGEGGESDDSINQTLTVFRNELQILKDLMSGFDFSLFFNGSPLERLQCLQNATEYILAQPSVDVGKGKKIQFSTIYKGHVRRMKAAYSICNPAGLLTDDEVAWAQCFMGICAFLNKITDGHHDTESMNRHVEEMLKEALKCSGVETILNTQTEEEIFSDAWMQEMEEVKMPNTKFQLLVKMLARAIKEYGKTNKIKASQFEDMLNKTLEEYNNRDNLEFAPKSAQEVAGAVNDLVQKRIEELTEQLYKIFGELKADKEEFKKLGITFEEKAFYDILVDVRNKNAFEYPDAKCLELAKEIKKLVDNSSMYADWINNKNIRDSLNMGLMELLYDHGYPPEWSEEIFKKILDQVENYKEGR